MSVSLAGKKYLYSHYHVNCYVRLWGSIIFRYLIQIAAISNHLNSSFWTIRLWFQLRHIVVYSKVIDTLYIFKCWWCELHRYFLYPKLSVIPVSELLSHFKGKTKINKKPKWHRWVTYCQWLFRIRTLDQAEKNNKQKNVKHQQP